MWSSSSLTQLKFNPQARLGSRQDPRQTTHSASPGMGPAGGRGPGLGCAARSAGPPPSATPLRHRRSPGAAAGGGRGRPRPPGPAPAGAPPGRRRCRAAAGGREARRWSLQVGGEPGQGHGGPRPAAKGWTAVAAAGRGPRGAAERRAEARGGRRAGRPGRPGPSERQGGRGTLPGKPLSGGRDSPPREAHLGWTGGQEGVCPGGRQSPCLGGDVAVAGTPSRWGLQGGGTGSRLLIQLLRAPLRKTTAGTF